MKVIILSLGIWGLFLSPAICQSEALSREVAIETYEKADKLLHQTYRDLSKLLDAEEKVELVKKQKAWIQKRDRAADKAAKALKGSNMYHRLRNETLMELTVKRYGELLIEYYYLYERGYYGKNHE